MHSRGQIGVSGIRKGLSNHTSELYGGSIAGRARYQETSRGSSDLLKVSPLENCVTPASRDVPLKTV